MATYCLTSTPLHSYSSSSSSTSACKSIINPTDSSISSIRFPRNQISFVTSPSSSSFIPFPKKPAAYREVFTVSAVVEGKQQQLSSEPAITGNGYSVQEDYDFRNSVKPYELYVCNLPRSCGIRELLNKFETYGTVQSVEVPRNAETGVSRGCGYVTMSSLEEAKAAIAALDGTDVDGREMRVRFSAGMNNKMASEARPQKNLIFESPYKIYVGNLAWSVKPEDLRNHFSQFGTVVSTRVLHDHKGGKNRVYGFLSFSSSAELEAAMSLEGTEFNGRTLKLREVIKWPEPEP